MTISCKAAWVATVICGAISGTQVASPKRGRCPYIFGEYLRGVQCRWTRLGEGR